MPGLRKTSRRSNKHHKNQTRVRKQSRIRKQKQKKRRTQKKNKRQKRTLKVGGYNSPIYKEFQFVTPQQTKYGNKIIKKNKEFYQQMVDQLVKHDINFKNEFAIQNMKVGHHIVSLTKQDTKGRRWAQTLATTLPDGGRVRDWIERDKKRHFCLLSSASGNIKLLLWFVPTMGYNVPETIPDFQKLVQIQIRNGLLITDDTSYIVDDDNCEITIVDGKNIKNPNSKTLTLSYKNDKENSATIEKDDEKKHEIIEMLNAAGISGISKSILLKIKNLRKLSNNFDDNKETEMRNAILALDDDGQRIDMIESFENQLKNQ